MTTYALTIMRPSAEIYTKQLDVDVTKHIKHAKECIEIGQYRDHLTYDGRGRPVLDKSFRDSMTMYPYDDTPLKLLITDEARAYADKHFDLQPGDEVISTTDELFAYPPGAGIGRHVDDHSMAHTNTVVAEDAYRGITTILYLNDEYEGGEIEFPLQNFKIKPPPGLLVMFPSNKHFPHLVHPITNGLRLSYQRMYGILNGKTNLMTV